LKTFRSNGKLLLTGEYVVLDGAVALAIPTKYGQSLSITPNKTQKIYWKSFDDQKNIWFETEVDLEFILTSKLTEIHQNTTNSRLQQILCAARMLNPEFLNTNSGFKIETYLDFPKNWGLGTSSTLINNVAQWAHVDAFKLLKLTFGGSGYDIACAQNNTPITYRLESEKPTIKQVDFNPSFAKHLYFVYLNKKQNSRDGIAHYRALQQDLKPIISEIDALTEEMIACKDETRFEKLIEAHEHIISKTIQQPTVKSLYFNDFEGAIKSLGAWGGDFILASSKKDPSLYFKNKGFDTVIPYNKMILK